ncbi:MAG: glycosyltransferase family 4 protein [Ignisphaera sp.]
MDSYAVIAHRFWNRPGGGEVVCAATAYTFDIMGFKPVLASIGGIDIGEYDSWFGINFLDKYPKITLYPFKIGFFGIYLRLLMWRVIKKAVERFSPQIVFVDEPTYRPVINILKERNVKLIEYIHSPIEASIDARFKGSGLHYTEDPYILERFSKFPLSIYWKMYVKLLPRYLRENPFQVASLVLANSKWTANIIKQLYGESPEVLNPPIAPNVEIVEKPREFSERENAVVMLGRFAEEKRYHWIVREVLPKLRREALNTKLYIFGGAKTKTSLNYLAKLEKLAFEMGFKVSKDIDAEADVYLIPNASRSAINMVMDNAKVFLHATVNEHWGVAIAEAMARGLPVVLHKSGGAWSDLAEEGVYALGYTNPEEAVEAIAKLLTDEKTWKKLSRHSIEKAKDLTLEKFVERLSKILTRVL